MENSTTVIIGDASYYNQLQKGKAFIFWMNEIPQSFVPSNITLSNGAVIVEGAAEAENSTIVSMDAQGIVDADLAQIEAAEGVTITWFEGGTAAKLYADGIEIHDRMEAKKVMDLQAVRLDKTFEIESGVKVTASIYLDGLQFEYNISALKRYAYVDLTGIATVTGQLNIDVVKMLGASGKLLMGSVNILGVGRIDIFLVYGLDGKLTVTYSADFETGFEYDRGTSRSIFSFVKKQYTLETQINAKLGVYLDAGIDLLLAKGKLYAETGAKAEYKSKDWNDGKLPLICRSLKAWIYAQAGYNVTVFGQDVAKDSITIYDYDNSPVRMNFHWEDGSWVPVCSRDPKETYFTTKWNSRFGGLGLGYGFDNSGNWVPVFTFTVSTNEKMEKVAEITGYTGSAFALTIPDTVSDDAGEYKVTSIGNEAFAGRTDIHVVNFPSTLEKIVNHAFFECTSLEQVIFPDDVTEIGEFAFAKCTNLSWMELPKNVKKIGGGAFAMTHHLTQVTIPKSLEETTSAYDARVKYGFHNGIFMESNGLKTVNFEEGTTKVVAGLLANTNGLESITIPEGITTIGVNAFNHCVNLSTVDLPSTLTFIGDYAFYDNDSLATIHIPENVTEIGTFVFAKCDVLSDVYLPDKLNKIGGGAFGACNSLTSIDIPANISETTSAIDTSVLYGINFGVFMQCENLTDVSFRKGITKVPKGLFANTIGLKTITIPDTVTEIEEQAFVNCKYLEKINFSKNLSIIGYKAFQNCPSLKTLEFPDTVKQILGFAFAGATNIESLTLPKKVTRIDGGAFGKCDSLDTVIIPKTLTTSNTAYDASVHYGVEAGIFLEGMGPKKIIFEEGTEIIKNGAFGFSRGVEEVVLPSTLKKIEDRAFVDCDNLKKINLPDSLTDLGATVFSNCKSLESISIPQGVTKLKYSVFQYCASLADVSLPDTLTEIGADAFRECGFTNIDIPDGVTLIGDGAFRGNEALTSITVPASVKTIGSHAFRDCTSLSSAEILMGVETINAHAFRNCDALTKIELPDSVRTLGEYALADNENLASVRLSLSLKELPNGLLSNDPLLEEVKVPYSVTKIGNNVFQNDYSLTDITILPKVQSIGSNAISYPGTTTIYGVTGSYAETYADDNSINFVPLGDVPASEIIVTPNELTMAYGSNQKQRLVLTIEPMEYTGDVTLEILDSGSDIISLTDGNLISGKKPGTAIVRVSAGSKFADVPVNIVQPATAVKIQDPSGADISEKTISVTNDSYQISAVAEPAGALQNFEWSCDDPGIATVDKNGLVSFKTAGTVTITAKTVDGSNKSVWFKLSYAPGSACKPGDFNGDGKVNTKDVLLLKRYVMGETVDTTCNNFDLNRDGKVNTKDVLLLKRYVMGENVVI